MNRFDLDFLEGIGVYSDWLECVRQFGGFIENTTEGWRSYINAYPSAWRTPVFVAAKLAETGWEIDRSFIWKIARIAFREAGKLNEGLAQYAETLGPDNWREAWSAATSCRRAAAAAADAVQIEVVSIAIAAIVAACGSNNHPKQV